MSSSQDPAQPSNYLQQQGSNNSSSNNPSNSGNGATNSNGRQLDHSHQFNQGPQSQQNQNQPYPPQQYQQPYYYQGGDYTHSRQQQQQQQGFPRYPGGSYSQSSQPSQQQYYHQDPQQQQQQQPQRSEDYYRQDHSPPMMAQGKPQQQQQQQQYQQQYQPQYQSQQYPPHPQQRHLALNNTFQQQQSKVLPSPSISLASDEYQAQHDYGSNGNVSATAGSSTGQSQQASASVSGASESVEDVSSPRFENESSLRFKVTLDAQTAAMQHQGDTPVTYLNKGQFYTITMQDTEEYDGDIHSVIKVTFHEEAHRKLAARYWSFWLSQQVHPKTARALDIEKASSTGMMEVQSKTFDRISFKWNGKAGAKLMVRFNCLSTDFSRIKGVKGIPLRVHMDTALDGASLDNGNQEQPVERSYAKIKLFRDKGAERKNKDDHKHLEKMWDKMRGKNADTNPLSQVLAPVQNVSVFWECLDHQEDSAEDETLDLSETLAQEPISTDSAAEGDGASTGGELVANGEDASGAASPGESNALVSASKKRRRPNDFSGGSASGSNGGQLGGPLYASEGPGSSDQLLDRDPSYVPQMRRRKQPMLCLYIKIGGEAVYRAVYLERLTLAELTQKLCEKLEIQASTISGVFRKTTKKELMVRVDDSMVAQMTDELDMVVEYDFNQQDGSVNLTLKY